MNSANIPIILKFDDWPAEDQQAWRRALCEGDIFDDGGVFSSWTSGTEVLHRQNYGAWLSYILRKHPSLIDSSIGDRVTAATLKGFIEDAQTRETTRCDPSTKERKGARPLRLRTVAELIKSLFAVLRGLAPERGWEEIGSVANKLLTRSNPYQLKPPIPITAQQLFRWALQRIGQLEKREDEKMDPLERATAFRQALMVGVLIAAPVRVRAIAAMTVADHLDRTSDRVWLRFSAKDMKDKVARSIPLPTALSGPMEHYIEAVRPILFQGEPCDMLWISRRGNPLSIDSFTSGLALLTKREFGIALRPHAFRHIAATSIAEYDPEHVGIIRDVLGHASLRMAEKHYNRATGKKVCSEQQSIVKAIRAEARSEARAERRGKAKRKPREGT